MATPNPPRILTNGTPVRDGRYRSDYPSSATNSPATMRPAASFSNPPSSNASNQTNTNSAVPTTQPLTVEGLLANNGNSISAALDAAVNERNALSAQNTQLWKLIEKQRSGYNHLMKEVERIRGERDLYRSRLSSNGENTDALLRAHRAKEKGEGRDAALRPTASHSQLKSSELSASTSSSRGTPPASDPRSHLMRTHSDESRAYSLPCLLDELINVDGRYSCPCTPSSIVAFVRVLPSLEPQPECPVDPRAQGLIEHSIACRLAGSKRACQWIPRALSSVFLWPYALTSINFQC